MADPITFPAVLAVPPNAARATYVGTNPWTDPNGVEWLWDATATRWSRYVESVVMDASVIAGIVHAATENTDPQDDDELLLLDKTTDPPTVTKLKYSQLLGGSSTKHASLTVGTGDAAITYEAVLDGVAGTAVSIIQNSADPDEAKIAVSIVGKKLIVTPGYRYGISVSECGTSYANGMYYYFGIVEGHPSWRGYGRIEWSPVGYANYVMYSYNGIILYTHSGTDDPTTGAWHVASPGLAPIPIMDFSGGSTSKQVAAAANTYQDATRVKLALVTYGGDGSSFAFESITQTYLSLI